MNKKIDIRDLPEFDLARHLETDADADSGRCLGNRSGGVIPEGDQPEEHRRLEPGEKGL